jgi:hypothetical protein
MRRDRADAGHRRSRLHSRVCSGRDVLRAQLGCEPDTDGNTGLDAEVQREATWIERDRAEGHCSPNRETDCDRPGGHGSPPSWRA